MKLPATEEVIEEIEDDSPDLSALASERGISEDVLHRAGIGKQGKPDANWHGWWAIPYPHRSGTWKARYRNPIPKGRPKYADDPGADFHLYNPLRLGPNEEEVWFAEGEFDTLALVDQGYKAIGIHGVKAAPSAEGDEEDPDKVEFTQTGFRKEWALLFQDSLNIVMFDNDQEGRQAGRRLAAGLSKQGLSADIFDEWDDQYTDINDWHRADPEGLGVALARFSVGVRRSRGLEPKAVA